jgi:hypothetical protein
MAIEDYSGSSLTTIFSHHMNTTAKLGTDKWKDYQSLMGT